MTTCLHCETPLHKVVGNDFETWVDETDGYFCTGDDDGVNDGQPHVPKNITGVPQVNLYEYLDRFLGKKQKRRFKKDTWLIRHRRGMQLVMDSYPDGVVLMNIYSPNHPIHPAQMRVVINKWAKTTKALNRVRSVYKLIGIQVYGSGHSWSKWQFKNPAGSAYPNPALDTTKFISYKSYEIPDPNQGALAI